MLDNKDKHKVEKRTDGAQRDETGDEKQTPRRLSAWTCERIGYQSSFFLSIRRLLGFQFQVEDEAKAEVGDEDETGRRKSATSNLAADDRRGHLVRERVRVEAVRHRMDLHRRRALRPREPITPISVRLIQQRTPQDNEQTHPGIIMSFQ